jgi:hypothetical protein
MPWSLFPSNPGVGDPTIAGWLTTAGYLSTSYLCWCVGRSVESCLRPMAALPRYWLGLSGLLLLLGINKQLDFQLWLTHWGRELSLAEGWYRQRGVLQITFVVVLAVVLLSAFVWLLWSVRHALPQTVFASTGTGLLVAFVLLRATSFDIAGVMLHYQNEDVTWALEVVGLLFVILSIGRAARTRGWRMLVWADPSQGG